MPDFDRSEPAAVLQRALRNLTSGFVFDADVHIESRPLARPRHIRAVSHQNRRGTEAVTTAPIRNRLRALRPYVGSTKRPGRPFCTASLPAGRGTGCTECNPTLTIDIRLDA